MVDQANVVSSTVRLSSSEHSRIRARRNGQAINESSHAMTSTLAPRRSSSIFSDSSNGAGHLRQSFSDSTNELLCPKAVQDEDLHQEPSLWYSLPLLFAIFPAITGVAFKRGSVFLTDLALLVLAAIYLNWCILTPWTWYHAAQSIQLSNPDAKSGYTGAAIENQSLLKDHQVSSNTSATQELQDDDDNAHISPLLEHKEELANEWTQQATDELRLHELTALGLCFLGPLLGSYVLHLIRSSLSQVGDELVSNIHLTLFVLAAEIRPLRYLMKIAHARTLHLQRMVRKDPHIEDKAEDPLLQHLDKRMADIEKSHQKVTEIYKDVASNSSNLNNEVIRRSQSSLQTQIDALNRAVRRYEKRATAQAIQNEARLKEIETRVREAVSLAAAVNYSQRPNKLSSAAGNGVLILILPFRTALVALTRLLYKITGYSVRILETIGLVKVVRKTKTSRAAINSKGVHGNSATRAFNR